MKFSLQGFDENGNGILDGQEIVKFEEELDFGRSFSDAVLKRAWTDSQMDGDYNTGTQAELEQYCLRLWSAYYKLNN